MSNRPHGALQKRHVTATKKKSSSSSGVSFESTEKHFLPNYELNVFGWMTTDPESSHALHAKEGYLNTAAFYIRAVIYFAVWTWLLRHLPASTVGFTVFLNPPLTTTSKFLLATLAPATFFFTIRPQEWIGGLMTLSGLAVAVYRRRK